MSIKDGIGLIFASGGIMLLALGRGVLGTRGQRDGEFLTGSHDLDFPDHD